MIPDLEIEGEASLTFVFHHPIENISFASINCQSMDFTSTPKPIGYTCLQGQDVKDTFKHPPLDGSTLCNEMIDWHMEYSPNHPFALMTPDGEEGGVILENLTYTECKRLSASYKLVGLKSMR